MKLNDTALILFVFLFAINLSSQSKFNMQADESRKIRFELINNLIVFPLELNGIELSFVLDTGVSKPILFNLVNTDSLEIKRVETIYLRGLGEGGSIQALRSKGNMLRIGDAINVNQDVYVVFDNSLNFTPRLGVPVHGIIGYDLFKDFVVEVNYGSKFIRLFDPDTYKYKKSKKWQTIPITLNNKKPYLDAEVEIDSEIIPVKLLMDTGGSDALWLFESKEKGLIPDDEMYFHDYLGKGLSGSVYGKRTKIDGFKVGEYIQKNVNVAFPDSSSLSLAKNYKERNGSISGNVLKRFNIYFDYNNLKLQFKKNNLFKEPYFYNNSGLVVEQRGTRVVKEKQNSGSGGLYNRANSDGVNSVANATQYTYSLKPSFEIVEIRETSNAKEAGLSIGDELRSINGKDTATLSLQEINEFFYDKKGKTVRLKVSRNDQLMNFKFKLDDVFAKKSPQ